MVHRRTIIAFDFGTQSMGMAIGQEVTGTARSLISLKVKAGMPDWKRIETLLKEWQPDLLVVGLPLNMDGSEQPLTACVRKFARRLEGRFGVRTVLHDERLTTVEARAWLFNSGGYRALDKGSVDAMSAVIILESWFSRCLSCH